MLKQAHLFVKGDVIGVGFRAWTKIQAKIIGVTGWVRNNHERPEMFGSQGGVEAQIQGEDSKVDAMIDAIKKGAPVSRVTDVEVIWIEPREILEGFEIRK